MSRQKAMRMHGEPRLAAHSFTQDSVEGSPLHRFVVRVGLSLSFRLSELVPVAEALEEHGYLSPKALQNLTDEEVVELQIPMRLAIALRSASNKAPSWLKSGPVKPLKEADHSVRDSWPGVSKSLSVTCADPDGRKLILSDMLAGFPSPLRDYRPSEPKPMRRSVSPSELRGATAVEAHVVAQEVARDLRRRELHEMRVSESRRERTPDAYRESTFHHKVSGPSMSHGRSRSIAGAELPQRCREMCGAIAPTIPDKEPGWGAPRKASIGTGGVTPRSPLRLRAGSIDSRDLDARVGTPKMQQAPSFTRARTGTPETPRTWKCESWQLGSREKEVGVRSQPMRLRERPKQGTAPSRQPDADVISCCIEGCTAPATNELDGRRLCRACLFKHAAAMCCEDQEHSPRR